MIRVYPTLLNTFSLFLHEKTNSEGNLMVDLQEMLDRINRVPRPTTEAQQKGIDFEKAITTGANEEMFSEYVIEKTRALLPPRYKTQVYTETRYKDCIIYGYVDIVGNNKAIDLKSTRVYTGPKFEYNHQNLYLLGLQNYGIKTLDYVITDFSEVYVESYHIDSYNFSDLYKEIDAFSDFVNSHRKQIRDKKLFVAEDDHSQLSLF